MELHGYKTGFYDKEYLISKLSRNKQPVITGENEMNDLIGKTKLMFSCVTSEKYGELGYILIVSSYNVDKPFNTGLLTDGMGDVYRT